MKNKNFRNVLFKIPLFFKTGGKFHLFKRLAENFIQNIHAHYLLISLKNFSKLISPRTTHGFQHFNRHFMIPISNNFSGDYFIDKVIIRKFCVHICSTVAHIIAHPMLKCAYDFFGQSKPRGIRL